MLIYVTFVIDSLKAFGILTNHCIIGFLYAKHAWYGYFVSKIPRLGNFLCKWHWDFPFYQLFPAYDYEQMC